MGRPPSGPAEPTDPEPTSRADRPARDTRLVPAAAAAWAVCWAATSEQWWFMALAGGAAVASAVVAVTLHRRVVAGAPRSWGRQPYVWCAVALVLVVLGGLGWLRTAHLHDSAVGRLADERAVVALEVEVTGDPRLTGTGFTSRIVVPVEIRAVSGRGGHWTTAVPGVMAADTESVLARARVGSRWSVQGRLDPPDPGDSIAAFVRVQSARQIADAGVGWQAIDRVREGLRAAVADRPAGPRALVPALVVGDTSAMTPEIEQLFVTTGLTHLTAVSGANLTLMLAFVMVLARWIGVRGRWLTVVGLLTVAMFVALCRTEPSVLRATAMGLVALAAVGRGGGSGRGLRHLCVAVIALLAVDPWLGRSVGFALSTLATAGILVWAGAWADRMRWAPRVVAESVAVPLAAQVATQPVVSAISGQVSVVGLLANALAGPLVGPATVSGFAAAGLSQVHPWLASAAGWLASWPAQGIIWIAEITGSLPGAAMRVPATPGSVVLIGFASLVSVWWIPRVLRRAWICLAVTLALVVTLARAPAQPGWPPPSWLLVMCDVGQGDAAVVRVGADSAVVVDTGPDPAALDRCLSQLGVRRIPLLVLTHFHADHIGGLSGVWGGREVGSVVTTPVALPAGAATGVAAEVARHDGRVVPTLAGDVLTVGTVRWETIWPTAEAVGRLASVAGGGAGDGESAAENDTSVVGRLTTSDGITILFTGDLEPTGQAELVRLGADVRAMVLKVPHHGSGRQDAEFLAATAASWAITSSGEDNSYGHPAPRTVRALQGLGMTVLRTDTSGAVALGIDHGRWVVRTQR